MQLWDGLAQDVAGDVSRVRLQVDLLYRCTGVRSREPTVGNEYLADP